MNAKIRTEGDPVPAPLDAAFLAQMPHILNLVTDFGVLDLTFSPAGPQADYRQWAEHASSEEIADGLVIRVASLDDIIESKRAANRDKDLLAVALGLELRSSRAAATASRRSRAFRRSGGDINRSAPRVSEGTCERTRRAVWGPGA